METRIEIKRVERDCPHNDEVRRRAARHPSRGMGRLIVDYNIYIDGEKRLVARGDSHTRGYRFTDAIGRSANLPGRTYAATASNIPAIMPTVRLLLENSAVPTVWEMAEHQRVTAERKAKDEADRAARDALWERAKKLLGELAAGRRGFGEETVFNEQEIEAFKYAFEEIGGNR